MKILFISGYFYDYKDANANILHNIIDILKENNEVTIISNLYNKYNVGYHKLDGYDVWGLYYKYNKYIKESYSIYSKIKEKRFSIFKFFLTHPIRFISIFLHKVKFLNSATFIYKKVIKTVIKNQHFDVLFAISNPIYTVESIMNVKGPKKVVFFLDHYSLYSEIKKSDIKKARLKENNIHDKMNWIFLNDFMKREYEKSSLVKYYSKTSILAHPNIKRRLYNDFEDSILIDEKKINCLYVGNFYEDIRNPEFLFKLIEKSNEKIVLHIIGSGAAKIVQFYKSILKDRLIIYGRKNIEFSFNSMIKSDYLVNVGNTSTDTLPSKILDYISCGKPIINIVKIDNCPTKEFTKHYPILFEINEDLLRLDNIALDLERFVFSNLNRKINFEVIESKYEKNTPKNVVNKIESILNGLLNE